METRLPVGYSNTDIIRGCGDARISGRAYLESSPEPLGLPLESYIIDPPIPYAMQSAPGVQFQEDPHTGVWHIFDHVGVEHYPYPSDVLEEGRLYGFSRRFPRDTALLNIWKLSRDSRLVLVHPRAIVRNAAEIQPFLPDEKLKQHCALYLTTGSESHFENPDESCSRFWSAVAPANQAGLNARGEFVPERVLTVSTSYTVHPLGLACPEPVFASGVIARLPITNVAVVRSADGGHEALFTVLRAQAGGRILVSERDR